MTDEVVKKCPKCGRVLSLTEFSKDNATSDGLFYLCKACDNKRSQVYYCKNHDDKLKKQQTYNRCVSNPCCSRVGKRGAKFEVFTCELCGKEFRRLKSKVDSDYEHTGYLPKYCSNDCKNESKKKFHTSKYVKVIERIKNEVVE